MEKLSEKISSFDDAAIIVVDVQNDFCPPSGSLAVSGGREIACSINELLAAPFALKIASRDFHPADHISFASRHPGAQPFISTHTISNPENPKEIQTTLLWPDHCVQGTPGCELISELETSQLDLIIDKGQDIRVESYSAFGPPFRNPRVSMTNLEKNLKEKGIKNVYVVGLAFDFCVKHTAIDSARAGFNTTVLEAATKAVESSSEGLAAIRAEMEEAGVRIIR